MVDFPVFVRDARTGTCVADVDIGACGTGDAADLGFVVVEIEDGVAFGANEVARLVVANGRMTSASTRHFGLGVFLMESLDVRQRSRAGWILTAVG